MKIKTFWRKNNQWLFAILGVYIVFDLLGQIMMWIKPSLGFATFSADTVNLALVGLTFLFIGEAAIWLYLRGAFPNGYNVLDRAFNKESKLTQWEQTKTILAIFTVLSFVFACAILALAGTVGLWLK